MRTVNDVKSIIKHAKLDEKTLTEITQTIYFPDTDIHGAHLKLLELNPDLLAEIEEGRSVSFKGGLNEKIVLTTSDRTYEVKEAEISNSLLLIPELKFAQETSRSPLKSPKNNSRNSSINTSVEEEPENANGSDPERILERRDVLRIFHDYYECREIQPRFRKLYDLLQLTRYSGPENEHLIDDKLLFDRAELLASIQCSAKEFDEGLREYRALEIDNYMRMLDYEYEYRVVSMLLGVIAENSWALNEIDRDISCSSLDGIFPRPVTEAVFDVYTDKSEEHGERYQYRKNLVCGIVAQYILQQGTKFYVEDFLVSWQKAVPDGFHIDESYLKGIGIIDRDAKPPCVRALREINLPVNIVDRLRILFKTKDRWKLDEIQPYIEYFATKQNPVTGLLAKHTRAMTVTGIRYYVSKH